MDATNIGTTNNKCIDVQLESTWKKLKKEETSFIAPPPMHLGF